MPVVSGNSDGMPHLSRCSQDLSKVLQACDLEIVFSRQYHENHVPEQNIPVGLEVLTNVARYVLSVFQLGSFSDHTHSGR